VKIRPVGDELFHAGRRDRYDETNSRFFFPNFLKGSEEKKYSRIY